MIRPSRAEWQPINPNSRLFLIGICALFSTVAGNLSAQPKAHDAKKIEELKVDSHRRMTQVISTKDYQEKLPFSKFLELLSKQLSDKKKFTVRLDREAFGKDADKILNEMVVLPPVPARMVANTALRLALAQTQTHLFGVELVGAPGELIITSRDRSLYTASYDIRDVLNHTQFLHESFVQAEKWFEGQEPGIFGPGSAFSGLDLKADPGKPDEWIVRQIVASSSDRAGWLHAKHPSTIQVLDGAKLVIRTAPSVHESISLTLATLRRLSDLAVVMNARVYEVDRATYDKEFAPIFIDPKDKSARRTVARVKSPVLEKLKQQKLILEADSTKIRPFQKMPFISLRNARQYIVGPGDPDEEPAKVFGTVYDGVTFAVKSTVSPDRRCLRLELSQEAAQLVKITKGIIVDLKTTKDFAIDIPNVKKTSTSATIDIHDAQSIIMVVDYRPPTKDRVWLLLAAPMIYMEEEEERIRKGEIKSMLMADEKPAPVEPKLPIEERKPVVELPDNKDVKEILQAIVESVITDAKIDAFNGHYAPRGDKQFTLLEGSTIAWPKAFRPTVAGHTHITLDPDECHGFKKRLLGIRIDEFKWTPNKGEPTEATIDVVLDEAIRGALGACHVIYHAKRVGKRWKVEWSELFTY